MSCSKTQHSDSAGSLTQNLQSNALPTELLCSNDHRQKKKKINCTLSSRGMHTKPILQLLHSYTLTLCMLGNLSHVFCCQSLVVFFSKLSFLKHSFSNTIRVCLCQLVRIQIRPDILTIFRERIGNYNLCNNIYN